MERETIMVDKQPLISVIVPVYETEPYISRCIDSILAQTYSNLEILLIDDGSPDNCGKICDEYARKDRRIKVIHQINRGLSAARNRGLNVCSGEYIGFVDSDDFIHPEMYQRLYEDIILYRVKISFCHTNGGSIPVTPMSQPTECKDKEQVILRSMLENIWWSANTKLYHKSLFDNMRYPIGRTNEDYPVTMRVYDACDRIAVNYNKLYNYCVRENSICTSPLNIRKFDQVQNMWVVLRYMEEKHPEWRQAAEFVYMTTLLKLLGDICNHTGNQFEKQKRHILGLIKKHFPSAVKNPHILWKQKVMLFAASVCPALYGVVYKLYNCVHIAWR